MTNTPIPIPALQVESPFVRWRRFATAREPCGGRALGAYDGVVDLRAVEAMAWDSFTGDEECGGVEFFGHLFAFGVGHVSHAEFEEVERLWMRVRACGAAIRVRLPSC